MKKHYQVSFFNEAYQCFDFREFNDFQSALGCYLDLCEQYKIVNLICIKGGAV